MRKIIIANDTSRENHPGCNLTMQMFYSRLNCQYNGEIVGKVYAGRKPRLLDWPDADVFLVNGEGTFHDYPGLKNADLQANRSAVRVREYLSLIKTAKNKGMRVAIVNATFDNIYCDLSNIDYISCRDNNSWYWVTKCGYTKPPKLVPDVCFYYPYMRKYPYSRMKPKREGITVTDSVIHSVTFDLNQFAVRNNHTMLPFKGNPDPNMVLSMFMKSELVVTGRYHGVVFAMLTGTPFIAIKSNTHKIEWLVKSPKLVLDKFDESKIDARYIRTLYNNELPVFESSYEDPLGNMLMEATGCKPV